MSSFRSVPVLFERHSIWYLATDRLGTFSNGSLRAPAASSSVLLLIKEMLRDFVRILVVWTCSRLVSDRCHLLFIVGAAAD
jgi:hypothetical protein